MTYTTLPHILRGTRTLPQVGSSAKLSLPFSLAQNGKGGIQQLDEESGDSAEEADPQDAIDSAQAEVDAAKDRVIEDAKRLHDIADAIKEEQVRGASLALDNNTCCSLHTYIHILTRMHGGILVFFLFSFLAIDLFVSRALLVLKCWKEKKAMLMQ